MGTSAYAEKPWEASSQEQGKSVTTAFGSNTVSDWLKLSFNATLSFNVLLKEVILHPAARSHAVTFSFVLAQAVMQLWWTSLLTWAEQGKEASRLVHVVLLGNFRPKSSSQLTEQVAHS